MKIKTIYNKSYLIRFRRGKDVQKTEVVDTNAEEVHDLITRLFKERFLHPTNTNEFIPATQIQIIELDNVKKRSQICPFVYTRKGKDFQKQYALVYNLSPREVRLEVERTINNNH